MGGTYGDVEVVGGVVDLLVELLLRELERVVHRVHDGRAAVLVHKVLRPTSRPDHRVNHPVEFK